MATPKLVIMVLSVLSLVFPMFAELYFVASKSPLVRSVCCKNASAIASPIGFPDFFKSSALMKTFRLLSGSNSFAIALDKAARTSSTDLLSWLAISATRDSNCLAKSIAFSVSTPMPFMAKAEPVRLSRMSPICPLPLSCKAWANAIASREAPPNKTPVLESVSFKLAPIWADSAIPAPTDRIAFIPISKAFMPTPIMAP